MSQSAIQSRASYLKQQIATLDFTAVT